MNHIIGNNLESIRQADLNTLNP